MTFFSIIPLLLLLVTRCDSVCRKLYCPSETTKSPQIPCDLCHKCLDNGARFCFTSDNKQCGCATHVPPSCTMSSPPNFTYCHVLDDVSIPPPEIVALDEHSLSAVVPRFFQEPPFDAIRPSFLYLLAVYRVNGSSHCTPFGHIEAYHRNNDKCLLRVRLLMPKIDYTGHDNYYYDDRSPLETQFSRELFGDADNVAFWTEVTIRREEKLANVTLPFASVLKSSKISHVLP